jgi:16S rRNA processing protein RimM
MLSDRVVVAEILKPRGNRGELLARSQTDIPGRLENLKHAHAQLSDGTDVAVDLAEVWPHKGDWVLKLAGVDSIDAADLFRGADLWVAAADRGTLPKGEFFRSDLTGCSVVDAASGNRIGKLEGWQESGGPPLMEVIADGRQLLIPFVTSLCQVDLAEKVIKIDLPAGLLDL